MLSQKPLDCGIIYVQQLGSVSRQKLPQLRVKLNIKRR